VGENLKYRILAAIVLIAVVVAALYGLPTLWWALLMGVVLVLGAHEWALLAGMSARTAAVFVVGTVLIALRLGWAGLVDSHGFAPGVSLVLNGIALLFWIVVAPLWLMRGWRVHSQLLLALVGWLVLVSTWFSLVLLQSVSPSLCLALMALVWLADSAAYFSGRRFGRHKLAPAISPGKTREGVYGALVVVALYAVLLALLAPALGFPGMLSPGRVAVWIAGLLLLAVLSVLGDLFESWLKRVRGVKDSGTLIPGHGGVLDRIDALTSAMPAAALMAQHWLR
jgi:phosphatidate cytidylyltransferase